jgi:tetratricopeptide (TPR) repeat protein
MMKLAGDAVAAGMRRSALGIYQLVPPVEVSLADARARLGEPDLNADQRKKLESAIKSLDSLTQDGHSPDVARLTAVALLSEQTGNLREAYEALAKLEQLPGKPGVREEILLHLVRLSAQTATPADTRRHAGEFIKAFPESPNANVVRRILLDALFEAADYDACIETSRAMIGSLKPATPDHDEVLFMLGASLHYRGRFDEAGPLLEEHVKLYPESGRALRAAYLQACNETRLRKWDRAVELLDLFLKQHPDASSNIYLPYALCDLATCQSARRDPVAAFGTLMRATDEFPESGIIEVAWLMRGDVERVLGQPVAAEKSYSNALTISEKRGSRDSISRSLASLVVLFSEEDNSHQSPDRTVAFADRYWKDPAEGSPDKARVAVAAAIAYVQVGRGEEGLGKLREVILETARKPDAIELEAMIRAYTSAYLLKHRPSDLLAHYDTYLGLAPEQTSARALLRMAAILVFENLTKPPSTPDERKAAEATVETLFHQLKTVFPPKDLEDFIRIRIGDLLRCHTNSPGDALPYYEAVIARPDSPRRFQALMGRADVFARSGDPQVVAKGIEDYERVIRESGDAGEREFAFYQNIVLWTTRKDYRKAAELAGLYLDQKKSGFSRFIPQVRLCLARCLDELKMVDEAIPAYSAITKDLADHIGVSAPAMLGWLRLTWERNQPGDRKTARETGRAYLEHTKSLRDQLPADDRDLWDEVAKAVDSFGPE